MLIQISSKRICAYFEGGRLLHVVLNKQTREWSSCFWQVYSIYQEWSNRTKIQRREHKHMDIEIIGSDLTEKKLFSFTNSAVVQA